MEKIIPSASLEEKKRELQLRTSSSDRQNRRFLWGGIVLLALAGLVASIADLPARGVTRADSHILIAVIALAGTTCLAFYCLERLRADYLVEQMQENLRKVSLQEVLNLEERLQGLDPLEKEFYAMIMGSLLQDQAGQLYRFQYREILEGVLSDTEKKKRSGLQSRLQAMTQA